MRRDALAAVAALGIAAVVAAQGVHASFSETTTSADNAFSAGTVLLGDNDVAGSALLTLTAATPGATDTGCITVTYTGTLAAGVHLYATVTGTLAPYLELTVTRGTDPTPTYGSCASFVPDTADYVGAGPGVVYAGRLGDFPAAAGVFYDPSAPSTAETWTTGEVHTYRFSVTLVSDGGAQGRSAAADFHWRAANL